MKIKKIVDICKKSHQVTILNEKEGIQWLGDGVAFYPLYDAPLFDTESLCATFDITEKQQENILFRQEQTPESFCFSSECNDETYAERCDISLNYKGEHYYVFNSHNGALYVRAKYLSPLNQEGLEIYLRQTQGSVPYFVCKNGFLIQALIMPSLLDSTCKEFAGELDNLYQMSVKAREDKCQ